MKATNYGLTSEREEKGSRSDFARNKRYRNNARRASAIQVRERERERERDICEEQRSKDWKLETPTLISG